MKHRIERRFIKGLEVRADDAGKLSGHAAVFGQDYVLWDSPTLRVVERIKPGAFTRSLQEKQDVRCLFNHDANNVLGRTANDTLALSQNDKGLYFECQPPATQMGRDVPVLIKRGDVTGCSFGFMVTKQSRSEEEIEGKTIVTRVIEEVSPLFDVGPVTYPAYTGTDVSARAELRDMFPGGVPDILKELRDNMDDPNDDDQDDPDGCACGCMPCYDGECEECDDYMQTCGDAKACNAEMRSARAKSDDEKKTKRVDGEDLSSSAFAYVGDPDQTASWKLPIKFSTEEKTKSHIRNALARINQTKGIPDAEKSKVKAKIVAAAKANGIHASDESNSLDLDNAKRRTYLASLTV